MKFFAGLIIGLVVGTLFGVLIGTPSQKVPLEKPPIEKTNKRNNIKQHKPFLITKYVHKNINVRRAPGTKYEIVNTLRPGDIVKVDSLLSGWYRVHKNDRVIGFVSASLLHDNPLARYDLEIIDVSYRVTERNNTWWRFSWIMKIHNTGLESLSGLHAKIKFLDSGGFIVDTDDVYGISLGVNQERTIRDYQLINVPEASTVQSITAHIDFN